MGAGTNPFWSINMASARWPGAECQLCRPEEGDGERDVVLRKTGGVDLLHRHPLRRGRLGRFSVGFRSLRRGLLRRRETEHGNGGGQSRGQKEEQGLLEHGWQ